MDEENKQELCKNDPFSGVDWRYEFSAPKFYDFTSEESEEDVAAAERWFDNAIPYENSRTLFLHEIHLALLCHLWLQSL